MHIPIFRHGRYVSRPLPDDVHVQGPRDHQPEQRAKTPPVLCQDHDDDRPDRQDRAKRVQEIRRMRRRRVFVFQDLASWANDSAPAATAAPAAGADVDGDSATIAAVVLVDALQVVDGRGIGDLRDVACGVGGDFRDAAAFVRGPHGLGALLDVQAWGEDHDVEPGRGAGYGGAFGGCGEVGESEDAGAGEGKGFANGVGGPWREGSFLRLWSAVLFRCLLGLYTINEVIL